jgi:hypothetical protein
VLHLKASLERVRAVRTADIRPRDYPRRGGLEAAACKCHAAATQIYARS